MSYRIGVIPGDGIGREVIPATVDVLAATDVGFEWIELEAGWDCFQRRGSALPPETLEAVAGCEASLFGAVSSPSSPVPGYRSPIVALRQELDLFANLRPIRSFPGTRPGVDMLIVRENTEGMYAGQETSDGDTATAKRIITRRASERIVRLACQRAVERRRQLSLVHKANILRQTCGLFRSVGLEVAATFPALEVKELLVDTAALRIAQSPEHFDVLVTTNLFGDILSDEAAGLVGGLGLAPSGNVGEVNGVFEPVHGSAPDIAGRGAANPIASVLAGAMMLDFLGEELAANRIRKAVESVLAEGPHPRDLGGTATTSEVAVSLVQVVRAPQPTRETH